MKLEDIIINVVCNHFKLTKQTICSLSRREDIARARQICFYLYRVTYDKKDVTLINLPNLFFGRSQNHATVLYSIKTIAGFIEVDKGFKRLYEDIKKDIDFILLKDNRILYSYKQSAVLSFVSSCSFNDNNFNCSIYPL